jgi:glycosyltransferase involved in cell wall biosynthesis
MKIRFLVTVGNLGRGGAEKQLVQLLTHAPRDKIEILVVNFSREADEFWTPTVRALPLQYIQLPHDAGHLRRFLHLRAAIRAFRPDVVWSWHFFTGLYVWLAQRLKRSFSHILGIRNEAGYQIGVHSWAPRLIRRADLVVSNAQRVLTGFEPYGLSPDRAAVLENSVEVDDPPAALAETPRTIGMCGNFHERKGIDTLLHAIATLGDLADAQFVIAGTGDATPYKTLTQTLGLTERVTFREDIICQDEIATFDIFVLPSRFEGVPNVLLEAMALGRPCVATRVGGVADVARDLETALLVPPEQPEALAAAIRKLWEAPKLRQDLSEAGRQAMQQRTPKVIAEHDFMAILNRALTLR